MGGKIAKQSNRKMNLKKENNCYHSELSVKSPVFFVESQLSAKSEWSDFVRESEWSTNDIIYGCIVSGHLTRSIELDTIRKRFH